MASSRSLSSSLESCSRNFSSLAAFSRALSFFHCAVSGNPKVFASHSRYSRCASVSLSPNSVPKSVTTGLTP